MASSMPPWHTWPKEIQFLILQALLNDGCSLARLASVSRQWQDVIEAHNFAKIKVTPLRLVHFGARTRRNRFRVKYIWLCLELDNYTCCEAYSPRVHVGGRVSQNDFDLIKGMIGILFRELSLWEPSGELVLDIGIHSPSDSKHLLKHLTFKPDMPSRECLDLGDLDDMDEAGRVWINRSASGSVVNPIKKTFSEIGTEVTSLDDDESDDEEDSHDEEECYERELGWLMHLPDIPAVTGVMLRQQSRRRWNGLVLSQMLDHFPNLQEVFYEPWRSLDPREQNHVDRGYDFLINDLTRQGVRRLTIFENCSRFYAPLFQGYRNIRTPMTWAFCTEISNDLHRTAALASLKLEQFSAAYLIDAALFFASCQPSWTWPNLTSLTLTLPSLVSDVSQTELVEMLTSVAGVVGCRMPKLETMELWGGVRHRATLFQYQSKPPTVTWRSTWEFDQLPSVIHAWRGVAHKRGAGELAVKRELLTRADIKCHGDAIHYLKLIHPVVRPISLQQIRTEDKVHRIWHKMRKAKAQTD